MDNNVAVEILDPIVPILDAARTPIFFIFFPVTWSDLR
jgi:hypothetical protein